MALNDASHCGSRDSRDNVRHLLGTLVHQVAGILQPRKSVYCMAFFLWARGSEESPKLIHSKGFSLKAARMGDIEEEDEHL